jgi:hypothetical protein
VLSSRSRPASCSGSDRSTSTTPPARDENLCGRLGRAPRLFWQALGFRRSHRRGRPQSHATRTTLMLSWLRKQHAAWKADPARRDYCFGDSTRTRRVHAVRDQHPCGPTPPPPPAGAGRTRGRFVGRACQKLITASSTGMPRFHAGGNQTTCQRPS